MRKLSDNEIQNLHQLTKKGIDYTIFQPTKTALKKSIIDATYPVRNFFIKNRIHDYSSQNLGCKDNGIYIDTEILTKDTSTKSKASLYRPKTKKGDPRMWFKKIKSHSEADDIISLLWHNDKIILINISKTNIKDILENSPSSHFSKKINIISNTSQEISNELLEKIKLIIKNGPIRSIMNVKADTAIGRTLEAALGIPINSSKNPDYKGIELKSFRSKKNRKNLFTQVPNWNLSKHKSIKEILENFGYIRNNTLRLYCTVSTKSPNSQGIYFTFDEKNGVLNEMSNNKNIDCFATWESSKLHQRLLEKHNETFWIRADTKIINGIEYFDFKEIIHTRKPILSQFDLLLAQGEITMDHLIKKDENNKITEKGPSFKISDKFLSLLFPPSITHHL